MTIFAFQNKTNMRALVIDRTISEISFIRSKYHNDIRGYVPLSVEEELAEFEKYKKGDSSAKDRIVMANLKFVISCAKKYEGCGVPFDDLVNEGNLGLIKAVERFDVSKGFKFISYAVAWIRQSILVSIAEDSRTIYLPGNITSKIVKFKEEMNKVELELGYVDIDEVMANTNITKDIATIVNTSNVLSTDNKIDDESEITLGDMLSDDDEHELTINNQYLMNLIGVLTKDEEDVIRRFFGFAPYLMEQPIDCIADNYNRPSAYVKRLYVRAIEKLQKAATKNNY
jgi:RNA polymerase primary sigma factor